MVSGAGPGRTSARKAVDASADARSEAFSDEGMLRSRGFHPAVSGPEA